MCDGGYDGGYCDPDYYDLEFRQQNPEIYGDDEYMQDYYGNGRYSNQQRSSSKKRNCSRKEKDRQFHEEYLRWKLNHPEKIAFFREKPMSHGVPLWFCIIAALIVYPLLIMTLIDACSN